VVATGPGVSGVSVGDEVCGMTGGSMGAHAELVAVRANRMTTKPAGVSHEQAAAILFGGSTARHFLRDLLGPGRRVLVIGASGAVGSAAVQLAHLAGAHVTGVCSARNADLVRSLGADAVVDYASEDFTDLDRRYDVVVDLVGNRSLRDLRRVLTPTGRIVLSGGGVSGQGRVIGPMSLFVRGLVVGRLTTLEVIAPQPRPSTEVLSELAALADSGALIPVIDRTFSLDEAAEAIRYLEVEHARAKVVIKV
jgi:NADPH:quinone reductase-like Zn-dependent oxidoreductase